jgi:hypothetical protein
VQGADGPLLDSHGADGWTAVALPGSQSTNGTGFNRIACVNATDCWMVGGNTGGGPIAQYDGTGWSLVPAFDGETLPLHGITCVDATDCWAVGGGLDQILTVPVIDASTVGGWTEVEGPTAYEQSTDTWGSVGPSGLKGGLDAVACAGADDCWAVGDLIEHYDGTSWTVVDSSLPTRLYGIACPSANDCWAWGSQA